VHSPCVILRGWYVFRPRRGRKNNSAMSRISPLRSKWELRGFPTTEVELLQEIKSWPVRLGQLLRQLMAAFTPLLILFGLKIVDAPLKEPAAPYLWAGAAAWALVGVVVTLDPAAKEKGEFAKDIAATVQSLRPGK
jgi:hypothetical protein